MPETAERDDDAGTHAESAAAGPTGSNDEVNESTAGDGNDGRSADDPAERRCGVSLGGDSDE